ncbi:MAG: porin [Holophaga sp.]|nr:porin [Holophaga sp.]
MRFPITPLAIALLTGPAFAQTTADTDKRITDLEQKVAQLSQSAAAKDAGHDGFSMKPTGRIFLDATYFRGGKDKLTDGTLLRTARLGWKAYLGNTWYSESEVDFSGNSIAIKDMWAGYQGFANSIIQVGHFKEPFGMDTLVSDSNIWFLERSYTDSWTPSRHIGLGYAKWGERWQGKASFYGEAIDDTSADQDAADDNVDSTGLLKSYKIVDNQGWGLAARLTCLPVKVSDTQLIHLGVAAAQRTPNAAAPGVYTWDFSTRPGTNKTSKAKFLNASVTNVDKLNQLGFEFAGLWGPFSWQSEYQISKVVRRGTQLRKWSGTALVPTTAAEQAASTVDHTFSTYYCQVSWVIGGQRQYDSSDAFFKSVTPSSKNGALELLARYNVMDQDDLTSVDPVAGGVSKNFTVGVNYYVNRYLRFMVDYTTVRNNDNAACSKAYSPTGVKIPGDDFGYTNMRMAVTF